MVCYNWCPGLNINKYRSWNLVTVVAEILPLSCSSEVFFQPLFQELHSTMASARKEAI